MTRFRTPDGLRFVTYQAAQQHWSRETLRKWFRDNTPHQVQSLHLDELVDRLREDWHVSKRNEPGREYFAVAGTDPVVDAIVDEAFGKGTM